ncbi:MAG: hypothetical protein HDT26_10660, partial [Subdoligranulum sp.]|nr:hypothetical protein [Subdoligranulum sp.]
LRHIVAVLCVFALLLTLVLSPFLSIIQIISLSGKSGIGAGTPTEGSTINRLFNKLIADNGLPKVVFHSIRHTSTTYKLMLSGGDIKGVRGDTGYAQATMVAERYAHILDGNRRLNAERFQQQFYSGTASADPTALSDPTA